MKIVILNGSPKKQGVTSTVLRAIQAEMESRSQVDWFDVYDLKIKPCVGCMKCRPDKECVLPEDDAHKVRREVDSADILIVGTPTYWGNTSAPLKLFFDRNVTLFESFNTVFPSPRQKGKKAAIVVASASPWPYNLLPSQSRGAVRSLKTVLKSGGYGIKGIINIPNMRPGRNLQSKYLVRATTIAKRLII
jgi:multimeric flavodoxin WrbA